MLNLWGGLFMLESSPNSRIGFFHLEVNIAQ